MCLLRENNFRYGRCALQNALQNALQSYYSPLELVVQSKSFLWIISCQMVARAHWKIRCLMDFLSHERQVSKLYFVRSVRFIILIFQTIMLQPKEQLIR